MTRKASKKPEWQLKIARERMGKLLKLAEENAKNPTFSKRYAQLALKIGMRYNIRLPGEIKRRICKKCFSLLIPGENCIVRTNPKQQAVIITCKNCGSVRRFPYRREKRKAKRPKTDSIDNFL